MHSFIHPSIRSWMHSKRLINKKMCSNRFSLRCVRFNIFYRTHTHTIRLHLLIRFCGLNLPVQTINYHKNEQNWIPFWRMCKCALCMYVFYCSLDLVYISRRVHNVILILLDLYYWLLWACAHILIYLWMQVKNHE